MQLIEPSDAILSVDSLSLTFPACVVVIDRQSPDSNVMRVEAPEMLPGAGPIVRMARGLEDAIAEASRVGRVVSAVLDQHRDAAALAQSEIDGQPTA